VGIVGRFFSFFLLFVSALFKSVALVTGFDDVAVVGKPIQQGGGHFGIHEDVGPLGKTQIGDDAAGALVKL
jgi:hypothetical protein